MWPSHKRPDRTAPRLRRLELVRHFSSVFSVNSRPHPHSLKCDIQTGTIRAPPYPPRILKTIHTAQLALYDLTAALWRIQTLHRPGMRKQPEGHSARLSLYPPSAYGPHAQAIHAYFSECKGKNTSRSLDFPTPANAGVLTTIRPQLKDALL